MVPTLVNAAVGALLAAALLGPAFDRRSVAVVVLAAVAPSADAVASLAVHGATNALLHTLFVPAVVAGLVYWDAERRESSWLRGRYGWWGVRVAWVAVAAYVVAGIGPDLFSADGAALLYPLSDRFVTVGGDLWLSTHEGVDQSYLDSGEGVLGLHSPGSTADHHVESWINPTPGTENPGAAERRLRIVEAGWQAVAVAAALVAVVARSWGDR